MYFYSRRKDLFYCTSRQQGMASKREYARRMRSKGPKKKEAHVSQFRRGDIWWYKFRFAGKVISEPSKSESKTVAKDAERVRRRELEESWNQINRRKFPPLFSLAAADWLNTDRDCACDRARL
jgi:hypothetical protein